MLNERLRCNFTFCINNLQNELEDIDYVVGRTSTFRNPQCSGSFRVSY